MMLWFRNWKMKKLNELNGQSSMMTGGILFSMISFYKKREGKKIMDEVTGLTRNDHGDFVQGLARENREDFFFQQR